MKISVIQRHCQERTQSVYLNSYKGFELVRTVTGGDLFAVTKKCLQHSSCMGTDWTLFVNADIRLYDDCIQGICEELKKVDMENTYQVGFAVDDRFLSWPIYGVFAHNNMYVESCYRWFQKHGANGIRAESNNIFKYLEEKNLGLCHTKLVVGSHDYEQWYRDVYDKFLVLGVRYRECTDAFIELLKRRKHETNNFDIVVALYALKESLNLGSECYVRRGIQDFGKVLDYLGIEEKTASVGTRGEEDNNICRIDQNCNFIDRTISGRNTFKIH